MELNKPKPKIQWIEGLRGIASVLVLCTHLARGWDYELFAASTGQDEPPRILQLPVLRIPWQGRIAVPIFAFLTGFVCALKPLKLARAGNKYAAFTSIAKSAFRRPPRLIIPATIILITSWMLCQFGAYTVANRCDSGWMRYSSPEPAPNVWEALVQLWKVFLSTWTTGWMPYDDHQWALIHFLKSAFEVYVVLVATMFMKYYARLAVYTGMYMYFWQNTHPDSGEFGVQLMLAMFLCDMSQHFAAQQWMSKHRVALNIAAIVPLGLGLYLSSYPQDFPEWATWSRQLEALSHYIFPELVPSMPKRFTGLGVNLMILSVFMSSIAKDFLSTKYFLWLGKNSFAVYLVHGTLLRIVFVWMIYGVSGQPWEMTTNEAGEEVPVAYLPQGGPWRFIICIPIWVVLVYCCAWAWTTYVDSWCGRVTAKLESFLFEEDEKSEGPLLGGS
ncbi:MAG: hypothetical protein M1834_007620 [Cirrosporium novae-zelandiae]|nr:MAG: hypothetical protein M1834_007620 [Cirrosporium novae-zelandiae]